MAGSPATSPVKIGLDDSGLLDMRSRELVLDGTRIHLTPREFETMRHLVSHRGEAVSRASLVEAVWGYDFTGESNVVEALIARLRRKLKTRSGLIETVWGFLPDLVSGLTQPDRSAGLQEVLHLLTSLSACHGPPRAAPLICPPSSHCFSSSPSMTREKIRAPSTATKPPSLG